MSNYAVEQINYTKADGTSKDREIISMSKPNPNEMVIEVTELGSEEREALQKTLQRHKEELQALNPAWKALKPQNISRL